MSETKSVIFVPHGGGPLPLLGHEPHASLTEFLSTVSSQLIRPKAIVVITAHWESTLVQLSTATKPSMLFDYYGFPPESYRYAYSAAGHPDLAKRIIAALNNAGIDAKGDDKRGFDHGTFVPLMLMYPKADIPVIQMSLQASLNPNTHIKIGEQLAQFAKEGVLIVGSGLSFHNLRAQFAAIDNDNSSVTIESKTFDDWLYATMQLPTTEAHSRLANWEDAPYARFCHPREEHLLPLHVCFGVAKGLGKPLERVYNSSLMGSMVSGYAA